MKKLLSFVLCSLMAVAMSAQTVEDATYGTLDFGIDGFAAYEGLAGNWYHAGGTTGGAGGKVVYANNFPQLQAYLQSSKPYIILVDHDISTGIPCWIESSSKGYLCSDQSGEEGVKSTYGERIMVASNKTLIGIVNPETGKAPLFSRITFVLQCQSNVIIRNCRFTMVGVPILKAGENKIVAWRDGAQKEVGDPDCIGIQADKTSAKTDFASHIWIDHCEFFNGDAANKDRYDGLVDCKNNVQWLTISYNLFHDHDKACLWGKGDSDVFPNCRTISAHHNWFKDIQGSRLPLQRGGHVHYMNNYQVNAQDGWDLRSQSVAYADACYFKEGKAPILPDGGGVVKINTEPGYGIIYDNCRRVITEHEGVSYVNAPAKYDQEFPASSYANGTWEPKDTWSDYFVRNRVKAVQVPDFCEKYSGAGKVEIYKTYSATIPKENTSDYAEAVETQLTAPCYDENGNKVGGGSGGEDTPEIVETVVRDPTISCENNVVRITTRPTDATIYYTVDGTEPTTESTVYNGPFFITKDITIKAFGAKEGLDNSDITSFDATYTADVTPMVTKVVYSNTFDAFVKQPTSTANGSITAYYMQGDEVPTISSVEMDGAVAYTLEDNKLTVSQGTNSAVYDVTLSAVTPNTSLPESATSFDGNETWVKTGYAYASDKGWRFAKVQEDEDNRRVSEGKTRLYFFTGPAKSVSLTNGGVSSDRMVKIYVNGKLTDINKVPKKTSTITIPTSVTSNNMIAVISDQGSGDGGFTKYAATPVPDPTKDATATITLDGTEVTFTNGSYTKNVAADAIETSYAVVVTPTQSGATVAATGATGEAGSYTIAAPAAGQTATATFTVTATDGTTTKTYTINIKKAEEGQEPDPTPAEGGEIWIDSSNIPTGYKVDGSTSVTAYNYSSDLVTGANLFLVESGQHTITIPAGYTVTSATLYAVNDNNTAGKGKITELAGKTFDVALTSRKGSSFAETTASGISVANSLTFKVTYKSGVKLKLNVVKATAISEVQEAKKFNSSSVQKAIVNGKLVIIKDGKQFNAAGAQVK